MKAVRNKKSNSKTHYKMVQHRTKGYCKGNKQIGIKFKIQCKKQRCQHGKYHCCRIYNLFHTNTRELFIIYITTLRNFCKEKSKTKACSLLLFYLFICYEIMLLFFRFVRFHIGIREKYQYHRRPRQGYHNQYKHL